MGGQGSVNQPTECESSVKPESPGHALLYRHALLMTLGATLVLGVLVAVLVGMSWRSLHRLEPLHRNLEGYGEIAREHWMLSDGRPHQTEGALGTGERADVLVDLARRNGYLSGQTPERLERAAALLASGAEGDPEPAQRALAARLLGESERDELAAQRSLLEGLEEDSRRELRAALAIAAILPLLAAAFWALFRRCVLKPLGDLGSQMALLARKDFRTIDPDALHGGLRPLFDAYNRLAGRMRDLADAHVKRESALREELERTTRALIEQQAVLARADRLAVSGDLTARMAHRLRSPLSGVLVALNNLRDETVSADHRERLRQSVLSLERSLGELSVLVDEARQEAEGETWVDLRGIVDDLFLLLGHQPRGRKAALDNAVPPGLVCRLPEAATRHALMSLLTNALEAEQPPEGRRVRVHAQDLGGRLTITVEDNRSGFTQAELSIARAGASAWSRRGGALGLAIVRRFVDHLGGTLVLENPSGGGARASLTISQVQTHG